MKTESVVSERYRAVKRLLLHPLADEKKTTEAVVPLALAHKDANRAVLVFLRRLEDVEKVAERWRVAHGVVEATNPVTEKTDIATLKGELDNLLAPAAEAAPEPAVESYEPPKADAKPQEPDDFSKLLAGLKI